LSISINLLDKWSWRCKKYSPYFNTDGHFCNHFEFTSKKRI